MITYERQQTILNYIKENKISTIKKLSKIVWASESSVRRDIKILEQKGFVEQVYGGVTLAGYTNGVVPIVVRDSSNSATKEKLAQIAAGHIFDGATILMDGSSTVRRIIKYINGFKDLKIITNNLQIFHECTHPQIKLYCTCGFLTVKAIYFRGVLPKIMLKT